MRDFTFHRNASQSHHSTNLLGFFSCIEKKSKKERSRGFEGLTCGVQEGSYQLENDSSMRSAMSAFYTTTSATSVVGLGTFTLNGCCTSRGTRRNFRAARVGATGSGPWDMNPIHPWSKILGDFWPFQATACLPFVVGQRQERNSRSCVIKLDFSKRRSQYQYRIAATNSSSSSFPGSSGVEEVKNFEDQDNGSALSAKRKKATTSREDDEDLASFVSRNGWGSDREVAEADFAERDHHRSQDLLNAEGVANVGDGGTFVTENMDESSEDSWERCSEDSAVGDSATSTSSITSPGSPTVGAKEPLYEVIEINREGKAVQKLVSRRQLLRTKGGLRLRDLRRVDPSLWVTNSAPALLVRDQAILLNLGSIRAIATPEDVLIFDHQSVGARGFMEILIPRLASEKSYGHSVPFELEEISWAVVFHSNDHGPLNAANEGVPPLPVVDSLTGSFEHKVLYLKVMESALISRTQRLERALMDVEPRVISLLEVLPTRLTADVLEELRVSKQALVEVGAKAGALRDMLLELLETPQDIRRMTIMGNSCSINREDGDVKCTIPQDKQVAEDEEEEIEMLLEYYLQRCESCHGQAEKLLSSAKEMEDSIAVNLSSRRLEVSRLELLLQVGTFCAALGALVAGIFGMNLKSYLEERAMAFWITTAGIILGGTFLYIYIVSYLKNRKIL